jgi:acetyl-CoA carboxylase biotin carboxyl carrier protein
MEDDLRRRLEALTRLFEEHGLEELTLEEDGIKVRLGSGRAPAATPPKPPPAPSAQPRPKPADDKPRRRTVAVRSPLIGVFYRSASPDAPTYVDIGDIVDEGQTVCVVEAMKTFNEIKAEWRGQVVAIPAENGKLVQTGQPLVVLVFLEE